MGRTKQWEGDGLTGRSEAQRREIRERIDRLYEAKRQAEGGDLAPTTVAVALAPASRRADTKRCTSCHGRLPATTEYFAPNGRRIDGTVKLHGRCRPCHYRASRPTKTPRQRLSPEALAEVRRRDAERRRARRRADSAAGIRPARTVLTRLIECRSKARRRLAEATDMVARERTRAHLLNLDHEIARLRERRAGG